MLPRSRTCPAGHGAFSAEADVCLVCGARLVTDHRGQAFGDFLCERLLGQGHTGATIWEGRSLLDGRPVALKLLEPDADPRLVSRLLGPAALLTGLYHQNLANVLAHGTAPRGESWLVMELLRGPTLATLIAQRGALTTAQALHIARETLHALSFLHARDIVHRDVKPGNIHLTARGSSPWAVRLLDFDLARVGRPELPHPIRLDEPPGHHGVIVGTPEYMAPEQVLGHEVDTRADLYALGVVLYRSLTGQLPYGDHADRLGHYHAHLTTPVRPARQADGHPIEPHLQRALDTALDKQPEYRFASAESFLLALA